MYKNRFKKWGLHKNLRGAEVQELCKLKIERDADGKETELFLGDQAIDFARIARHLARKQNQSRGPASGIQKSSSSRKPGEYLARASTPPLSKFTSSPEPFSSLEDALLHARNWIDVSFQTGAWILDSVTKCWQASNQELFLEFAEAFRKGRKLIVAGDENEMGYRFLNLAMAKVKPLLKYSHPEMLPFLMKELIGLLSTKHDSYLQLFDVIWDYIHKLIAIILPTNHPVHRIWEDLGRIIPCPVYRKDAIILVRFICEHLESYASFGSSIINILNDCWYIESLLVGHEINIAEMKAAMLQRRIAKLESHQDICALAHLNHLRQRYAEALVSQGNFTEARAVLDMLLSQSYSTEIIIHAMSVLARIERKLGQMGNAISILRQALSASDQVFGAVSGLSMDILLELRRISYICNTGSLSIVLAREMDLRRAGVRVGVVGLGKN
jgi:tetratricopeptide (TPR) repeat protein